MLKKGYQYMQLIYWINYTAIRLPQCHVMVVHVMKPQNEGHDIRNNIDLITERLSSILNYIIIIIGIQVILGSWTLLLRLLSPIRPGLLITVVEIELL